MPNGHDVLHLVLAELHSALYLVSFPSCAFFRILLPAALRSAKFPTHLSYYDGSDSLQALKHPQGLPCSCHSAFPTFCHQPPLPSLLPFFFLFSAVFHLGQELSRFPRVPRFANQSQARAGIEAETCLLYSYGLSVRSPLLSTPPLGDAVTVHFSMNSIPTGTDFHPSDCVHSKAHDCANAVCALQKETPSPPSDGHSSHLHSSENKA